MKSGAKSFIDFSTPSKMFLMGQPQPLFVYFTNLTEKNCGILTRIMGVR